MADWALRNNAASVTYKVLNQTTMTGYKPTGTSQGDLMVVMLISGVEKTPTNDMSSWTLVEDYKPANGQFVKVYIKPCGSSQANISWTGLGNGVCVSVWNSFYNVTPAVSPLKADSMSVHYDNSTSYGSATGSIADMVAGDLVISLFSIMTSLTPQPTFSTPTGQTSAYMGSGNLAVALSVNFETLAASGATGTRTSTISASTNANAYTNAYILGLQRVNGEYTKSLSDTLTGSEAFPKAITRIRIDTLTGSESFVKVKQYFKSFSDTLTGSETFGKVKQFFQEFSDTLTGSEVFANLLAHHKSFIDTLSGIENFVKQYPYAMILKRWNGTQWETVRTRVWNGTQYIIAFVKYWNGSEWKGY